MDGDEGTGSGRSIPAFDLLGGLHAARAQLQRYGGHRAAAGLSIQRENIDAFRQGSAPRGRGAHARGPRAGAPGGRGGPGRPARPRLAEELERLAPFGMGNPPPTLLVPCALLDNARALSEGRTSRSR